VIRIDAIWMSTEPLDMRAGFDKALARVVQVFGAAHPHHAYLFANARSNRMKVVTDRHIGATLRSAYWSQSMIAVMEPTRDRHIGASAGSP
jgi:transposase